MVAVNEAPYTTGAALFALLQRTRTALEVHLAEYIAELNTDAGSDILEPVERISVGSRGIEDARNGNQETPALYVWISRAEGSTHDLTEGYTGAFTLSVAAVYSSGETEEESAIRAQLLCAVALDVITAHATDVAGTGSVYQLDRVSPVSAPYVYAQPDQEGPVVQLGTMTGRYRARYRHEPGAFGPAESLPAYYASRARSEAWTVYLDGVLVGTGAAGRKTTVTGAASTLLSIQGASVEDGATLRVGKRRTSTVENSTFSGGSASATISGAGVYDAVIIHENGALVALSIEVE
jgi:hypothetical protein